MSLTKKLARWQGRILPRGTTDLTLMSGRSNKPEFYEQEAETHLLYCQTSTTKFFDSSTKILIIDIWQGQKYLSGRNNKLVL